MLDGYWFVSLIKDLQYAATCSKSVFWICSLHLLLAATDGGAFQPWGLKLVPNASTEFVLFGDFLVLVELIPNFSWSFHMLNPALLPTAFLGWSVRENKLMLQALRFGFMGSPWTHVEPGCCVHIFFCSRSSGEFQCLRDALDMCWTPIPLQDWDLWGGVVCYWEQELSSVHLALKTSASFTSGSCTAMRRGRQVHF